MLPALLKGSGDCHIKHHLIDHKTSRFFTQKLDAVAALVDKDEHIAVAKVSRHTIVDDAAKYMEALAHVSRLGEQPIPYAVVQTEDS